MLDDSRKKYNSMKIMKNLLYALFILAIGGFASCSDDDTERVVADGVGVYFAIDIDPEILIEKGQTSFSVPVYRTDASSDFDLPIVYMLGDDTPADLFSFPVEVHFAAGEKQANYEIGVSFNKLVPDVGYEFTLTLSDADNLSSYGHESQEFVATYAPWTYLGEGYFRDDILSSLFTSLARPNHEGSVKIYESQLTKGLYRVEEPFSPEFVGVIFGVTAENLPAAGLNCTARKEYLYFNASDPEKVYMPLVNGEATLLGVNWGEGDLGICSYVDAIFQNGPETNYGKMKNGVVTFPKESLIMSLNGEFYNFFFNRSGLLRILMPGTSLLEPIVTVNYKGILTDAEDNAGALFDVKMNVDAAGFYWAVFDDYLTREEVEAKAAAMFAGEIEANREVASTEVNYGLDTPGEYTAVFVPYSEELRTGEPVAVDFEYVMGGSGVAPADFEAAFSVQPDESSATFDITPNADNLLYYYNMMPKSSYDEILATQGVTSINDYDVEYLNYLTSQYGLTLSGVIDVLATKGPVSGEAVEALTPGETYVIYAYCINRSTGAARSKVSEGTFQTVMPENLETDYSAWIGTWTAVSTASWGLNASGDNTVSGDSKTFEFRVAHKKSNESFYLYNWDDGSLSWAAEARYSQIFKDDEKKYFSILNEQNLGTMGGNSIILNAYCYLPDNGGWQFIGGSFPALIGDISAADNTASIMGNVLQLTNIEGEFPVGGMAYISVTAQDQIASIYSTSAFYGVGPYTLTKKIDAATSSAKSDLKSRFAADRRNRLFENTPKAIRTRIMKTYNCVER